MGFTELSFPSSSGATTTSELTTGTLDVGVEIGSPGFPSPLAGHGGGSMVDTCVSVGSERKVGLYYLRNLASVCGGIIVGSQGTRFCTSINCSTKAHEDNKASLIEDAIYIKTGKPHQAKVFPRLLVNLLPKTWILDDLLKESKSISTWAVFFDNERKRDEIKVETVDEETIDFEDALNHIETAKDAFKTSAKVKTGKLLFEMVNSSPAGEPKMAPVPQLTDDASSTAQNVQLLVILQEWNNLLGNVSFLDNKIERTREMNQRYKEMVQKVLDRLSKQVFQALGGLQLINTQLGMEDDFEDAGINVRDILRGIRTEVSAIEHGNVRRDQDITAVEKRLTGMFEQLNVQSEEHDILANSVKNQFSAVERTFKNLDAYTGSQGARGPRNKPEWIKKGPSQHDFNTLKANYEDLREKFENMRMDDVLGGIPTIKEEQEDEEELSNLNKRVKELESRLGEQGFTGEYEVFSSYNDVRVWVQNEGIESSGIFWDLLSVLVAMAPGNMTGKELADAEYSSERIKATVLETDLSASMKQHRPRILFATSKTGALPKLEVGFGACQTNDEWIGGAESFKGEVSELLRGFCDGVKNVVLAQRGDWNRRGLTLAGELLSAVRDQWSELVSFIDSFYQLLTKVAKFPEKKAWALVGRCVATVFTAMRTHREKVFKMRDNGTVRNRANIIWAVLQCHRVMQEFIKVDFQGHPLIVQTINQFVITERVDPARVEKALEKMKDIEDGHKKLQHTLSKLEETVATLNRAHKDLCNEVKQIKKR